MVLILPSKISESHNSHKTSAWLGKISSVIQNAQAEQSTLQYTELGAHEQKAVTLCSDKERGEALAAQKQTFRKAAPSLVCILGSKA